ncbi:MAG TPA: hypothetical protein VF163_09915 [Micromonosporaceae bacterium]
MRPSTEKSTPVNVSGDQPYASCGADRRAHLGPVGTAGRAGTGLIHLGSSGLLGPVASIDG